MRRALCAEILDAARAQGATVATAESCTGGMIAAALTDPPGASAMFLAGWVTYANEAKQRLGVCAATLAEHGAVSEPVVREMAEAARQASGATLALAVSGIAGPGGSEFKPEGLVCFALAQAGTLEARTVAFGALGRDEVRAAACLHGLQMIRAALR